LKAGSAKMKKNHIVLIIVGLIFSVAGLTNPNQDKHKEVIGNKLYSYMLINSYFEKSTKSRRLDDGIIDDLVSTDNYVLFSTTKITWNSQTKIIGVGAFGNVYLTSKLNEVFNEVLP
jgi:hypothetical protein